ncbi:helix-turn-helix domain-containing protein [Actinomadura barringtoniae]|uniref:Helix-turn-helix domain-containing protein n=1 Tax=Actinomadura barringtoniae TaxID=1427535 RepID=A0A939PJH2_9ACTN|nr:helix-turn-helix domain-containing protein [Actinomadura barringtoniae]MBO2453298.1 helix-turn-helix domain-containing protein [Actinomadura barringtoniae]
MVSQQVEVGHRLGGSNRLLNAEEVARLLGVPKRTVYSCWRVWGLRGYKVGRHLRFRERELDAWLEGREVPASTGGDRWPRS